MKTILVSFDEPVAAAVLATLAEKDASLEVRIAGMEAGRAPKSLIEYTQREKSLCMNAYDALVRSIKGLEKPGQ